MLTPPRRSRRYDAHILNIPEKANRILNLILIAIVLILIRIWHLSVIQYEDKVEEARKPRARVVVEPAKRATIRDRFNLPLAINKVRYQAAILYSQLSEIPSISWEINAEGKRVKRFKRKEYIAKLAKVLGDELKMDPVRVEDLIYSKAAFLYQIPFLLKEDITEKEYYHLKMLQKDWLGIQVQLMPRRYYPRGKVGADIIGYMGAINRSEYDAIIHEIKSLEQYLRDEESGLEVDLPPGIANAEQARNRFKELREHAYTINDYVGKTGIEGMFEEDLRGFHGKKSYYSDARGNYLRELPGARSPVSGHRLLLTISAELQEYSEQLLIQNEQIREGKISSQELGKQAPLLKQPWIKSGAIVAMDPTTGEVIALASYPRFDPNDFIMSGSAEVDREKRSHILQWFENESYLTEVWNQKRPLVRELFDKETQLFYEEERFLTWDHYLDFILPSESSINEAFARIATIRNAVALQNDIQLLLELSGQPNLYQVFNRLYQEDSSHIRHKELSSENTAIDMRFKANSKLVADVKRRIEPFLGDVKHHYNKVLTVDLCQLAVCNHLFSEELMNQVGKESLSSYRNTSSAAIVVIDTLRKKTKELFHELAFKNWRKENEKEFLKEKRKEEKLAKRYPKPYLDYLDAKENELFLEFWSQNFWELISVFLNKKGNQFLLEDRLQPYLVAFKQWDEEFLQEDKAFQDHYAILKKSLNGLSSSFAIQYLKSMRSFRDLNRPLFGRYKHLRQTNGAQLEKHLAMAFYPMYGFGYGRSQAYRQAATQGSIFKIVTAYEALRQRYQELISKGESLNKLNPLEIVDDAFRSGTTWYVGYHLDGKPIPQLYKGGRLPRSHVANIGKLDLVKALEVSSNPYFSILAGDVIRSPQDLEDAARAFSFGSRTGIDLPTEIPGKIPQDINENRTGLYSFAIGQHSFVVTPLQTAVMLSAFANGGNVYKPKIVNLTAGRERYKEKELITLRSEFPYRENLALAGIEFPLFTAVESREQESLVNRISAEVKRKVFLPSVIRELLLKAMQRVTIRCQIEGLSGLKRLYHNHPEAIRCYQEMKDDLLGKTSTAESLENLNLDLVEGTCMCKHVWFGGIAFDRKNNESKTFISRDPFGQPELVVVVYLRYGGFGKEAAPIAAQVVKKWREIKEKHESK